MAALSWSAAAQGMGKTDKTEKSCACCDGRDKDNPGAHHKMSGEKMMMGEGASCPVMSAAACPMQTPAKSPDKTKKLAGVYPLTTCPISGEKLGEMGKPVVYEHEGREVRFCCKGCIDEFKADAAGRLKAIDQAIIDDQKPLYALKACPISGQKLGEMGEPADRVIDNRLVRFCCGGCEKKFKEDIAANMAKLDKAAIDQQSKDYPLEVCPLSGEKLGSMGDPIEVVVAGRLVRLCCEGCVNKLARDPSGAITKIDQARKAAEDTQGNDLGGGSDG
jgi:hypothetical protein